MAFGLSGFDLKGERPEFRVFEGRVLGYMLLYLMNLIEVVWYLLVLLYLTYHIIQQRSLREIDQLRHIVPIAVLYKRQICQKNPPGDSSSVSVLVICMWRERERERRERKEMRLQVRNGRRVSVFQGEPIFLVCRCTGHKKFKTLQGLLMGFTSLIFSPF